MSQGNSDKSIVVWHPGCILPSVPDDRELTSLCLLHDEVVLTSFGLFGVPPDHQESTFLNLLGRPYPHGTTEFIKKVQYLVKHGVITLESKTPFSFSVLEGQIIGHIGNVQQRIQPPNSLVSRFVVLALTAATDLLNNRELTDINRKELEDSRTALISYSIARFHKYPFVTSDKNLQISDNYTKSVEVRSEILAQSAICELALPDVRTLCPEDLLEARTELRDELLEFRAGILKLTWLLHQRVRSKADLKEIRGEATTLVNTAIRGSLLSLENRMRHHNKSRIRRMLLGTARVLVDAGAFSLASLGKILFKIAGELDSAKPPEDQVGTYLYRLKGRVSSDKS